MLSESERVRDVELRVGRGIAVLCRLRRLVIDTFQVHRAPGRF